MAKAYGPRQALFKIEVYGYFPSPHGRLRSTAEFTVYQGDNVVQPALLPWAIKSVTEDLVRRGIRKPTIMYRVYYPGKARRVIMNNFRVK